MENLLGPAIVLGIWAGICVMDMVGPQFMLWRPLISGAGAGLLLGDLETGLIIGGGVELTWLVLVNIGGAAPPDVTMGGIVAVAVAHFTGEQDVGVALAAALPAALLAQQAWSLVWLANTYWIHRQDAAAERGDLKATERLHIWAGFPMWFVPYFLIAFASVYWGIPALESFIGNLPDWLMGGLAVAGGLLPALGITLLLSQIITNINWPYFLAGFVIGTYLGLPVIGTALLGFVIAFLLYFAADIARGAAEPAEEAPAVHEGMLTKADRRRMFFRSWTAISDGNAERHLAGTFLYVMGVPFRKFFKTKEEMAEAMKRHLVFYNVQPTLTTMVMGSVAAMEESMEEKEPIIAYKAGVMGPLAGVGDSLIWLTLMPLTFAIGASLAVDGNAAGPIVALLLFNVVNIPLKYYGIELGYTQGMRLMEQLRGGLMDKISKGAAVVGLMVMGTALVRTVSLTTPITIKLGDDAMPIQPAIDAIMPGLLTLLLSLLILWALRKRVNPVVILLLILVLSVFFRWVGIL
jgi:PTS system mannose-specific IID component